MSEPVKTPEAHPGFQVSEIIVFSPARGQDPLHPESAFDTVRLALPDTREAKQLVRDRSEQATLQSEEHCRIRAKAKRIKAEERIRKEDEAVAAHASTSDKSASGSDNFTQRAPSGKAGFNVHAVREKLRSEHAGLLICPDHPDRVQIMNFEEPLKLIDETSARTPDRDLQARDRELYTQLRERGAYRAISRPADIACTRSALAKLRRMQPHFSEVIDFIEGQLCLALQLKTPHRIPPILLGGPPGIGKTHFTLELAKAMTRPIRRHSFDASHTGSALMGSDRNWANTRVGLVFEMVCLGLRADPIVLLDELDKADTYRGGHATAPLHSLLEPLTATSVTDISAGVTFDASHIFWVATANELWRIPPPILTRFRIFDIQPPTASEALTLAQAVADSVHGRFTAFVAPGRRITALVAHLTPREQIQVLEQGYAAALVNDRRQILPQDLPPELRPEADAEAGSQQRLH